MIRIARGPEPERLRTERRKRLSQAMLDRKNGRAIDFTGYKEAKDALAEAMHYKCAFCEMDLRKEGNPVEHFRPKAFVENEGEPKDESRYWWLTWTWENLLFACDRCNTWQKKNAFPLEKGTAPLPELSFDLEKESPLLIDPTRVDPREHIRFQWSPKRGKWLPIAVAGSTLGDKTIRILGLDTDDVAQRHAKKIEAFLKVIQTCIDKGDVAAVRQTWRHMLEGLFAKGQAFHALTWDMLDHRFPKKIRSSLGLRMPKLGRHGKLPPSPVFVDPPEMASLPEPLKLRVRALGTGAPVDVSVAVLKDVLSLKVWTDEELARLFEREASTIHGWKSMLAATLSPPVPTSSP